MNRKGEEKMNEQQNRRELIEKILKELERIKDVKKLNYILGILKLTK